MMYDNEMGVSRQVDPRANQKARTKTAILDAAVALLSEGEMPTVASAAERAKVSRATAYRYFPTREDLGEALANADPMIAAVDQVVDKLATDDVEQRLLTLLDSYNPIVIADEAHMRSMLQILQENWLKDRRDEEHGTPYTRSQTRVRWLDEVLRPAEKLTDETRHRLRAALALTLGIESIVVMKDVCGLDDADALSVLRWAATTLLQAVLDESQPDS
jgi:AcrR family transcriptional regulator